MVRLDDKEYDINKIEDIWRLGKEIIRKKIVYKRIQGLPQTYYTLAINLATKVKNKRTFNNTESFSILTWYILSRIKGRTFYRVLKFLKENKIKDPIRKLNLLFPTIMQYSLQDAIKALIVTLEAFLDSTPMVSRPTIPSPDLKKDAERVIQLCDEVKDKVHKLIFQAVQIRYSKRGKGSQKDPGTL